MSISAKKRTIVTESAPNIRVQQEVESFDCEVPYEDVPLHPRQPGRRPLPSPRSQGQMAVDVDTDIEEEQVGHWLLEQAL